ncbi:MAG: hypothetical protein AMJ53_05280 [Gammaproteobacteria bacterium SG8_11]|nr:MAG: hypothetical protein AMJ53_05280 [Gammaproteobacteria bacterium SG8_11]
MSTSHDTPIEATGNNPRGIAGFDLLANLPNVLRILGTGVLLIAMYSFLAKGWQSGNDGFRYLMMLGHTGILAAIGVASGHWLKESKGARLLLTLALVSVPANFAILGAFIFSQTIPVDIHQYPTYVAWSVESLSTALLTSAGAMLVLVPVSLLGFMVLARSMSKTLTGLFLISNAALLLPLRDPQLIGLVVLVLTVFCLAFTRKSSHQQIAAKTQEGITALGLQFLPLAVLMGRSLWLYSFDLILMTVLAITVFFTLRQTAKYLIAGSKLRNVCDALSLIPSIAVIPLLGGALFDMSVFPEALVIPLAALVAAAMIYDISRRNPDHATRYRHIASGILLMSMVGNLMLFQGLAAAIACIIAGMGLVMLGYQKQQRSVFASGVLLLLTGLSHQIYELVHHFDLGSWISLAVLGVFAIVLASTIESQGGKLKTRFDQWKTTFKQWER